MNDLVMFSFAIFVLPIVIHAESTEATGMIQVNPIKLNAEFGGNFTFYNDKRIATCGKGIFANYEILAAVSGEWFAKSPQALKFLCKTCLKVDYRGKRCRYHLLFIIFLSRKTFFFITVPIKDKCVGCNRNQVELSLLAYRSLEAVKNWRGYGATFAFVACPDLFTLID